MSTTGREIVGPGYSMLLVVHSHVGRDQQALKRDGKSSGSVQGEDCTVAEVGGETSFAETPGSLIPPRVAPARRPVHPSLLSRGCRPQMVSPRIE
jgi:hypothetical protein